MEKYDEILMWREFNRAVGVVNNLQMELTRNGGGSGWTKGMVNSFVMSNGLPIYAPGSGYNADWEKEGVNETLQNRASRIVIFTKKPGDVNFYQPDGSPACADITLTFGDAGSEATTGFMIKKVNQYSPVMAQDHTAATSGGVVFGRTGSMLISLDA